MPPLVPVQHPGAVVQDVPQGGRRPCSIKGCVMCVQIKMESYLCRVIFHIFISRLHLLNWSSRATLMGMQIDIGIGTVELFHVKTRVGIIIRQ